MSLQTGQQVVTIYVFSNEQPGNEIWSVNEI